MSPNLCSSPLNGAFRVVYELHMYIFLKSWYSKIFKGINFHLRSLTPWNRKMHKTSISWKVNSNIDSWHRILFPYLFSTRGPSSDLKYQICLRFPQRPFCCLTWTYTDKYVYNFTPSSGCNCSEIRDVCFHFYCLHLCWKGLIALGSCRVAWFLHSAFRRIKEGT